MLGFLPLVLAGLAAGAEVDTNKIPAAAAVKVNFDRDIRPILQQSCLRCHGPEKPKSHFRLTDREAALKGGDDNQDDIIPGDSAHSKLIYYVSGAVEDMQMPPSGKAEPLTPAQIGLLRAWIDQGAVWTTTNQYPQSAFSMTPALGWIGLNGSQSEFQAIEGTKPGFGGGLQDIFMEQQDAPDKKFTVQGHFLAPDADLGLKIDYTKTDSGFVRSGFDMWRKYYDDRGGFVPLTNSFSLHNNNLYLDNGRAWIDFGLTLPNRPQVVLGYEYQFKQGDESTLQWGAVQVGANTPHITPASKHIDENTSIIKLNVSYEPGGWKLEDNARVEFYSLQTSRTNGWPLSPAWPTYPPTTIAAVAEGDRHTQGMNTLSVNKQLTDWMSVSSGYYYSQLDGSASVQQNTLDSTGGFVVGNQWSANDVSLKRQSQVVSVGSLLGPWAGLTCSAGVQGEWSHQESSGLETLLAGVPPPGPTDPFGLSSTNNEIGRIDLASARESLVVRYTTIPRTVVFAEARLQQENLQRYSQGFIQAFYVGSGLFTNNSDGNIFSQEYRAGFNTSPWQRFSFGADYKYNIEQTDYSGQNSIVGAYPGFIEWRETEGNQVNARLVYRPTVWLRTSFNFQWQETDFRSAPFTIPGFTSGEIEGGQQEAHIYSFNTIITPARRVYLTATLSYSDSRIDTPFDGATSGQILVPWQGQIYSALASATYLLNTNTDVHLAGVFSQSDFAQNNQATGLPAGINYQHYGLQVGVTRRFAKNLVANLAYSFYQYREPTSGNYNNYIAQGVLGSLTIPWP
jgi:hypothetical protein